jgi:hypothetical protein
VRRTRSINPVKYFFSGLANSVSSKELSIHFQKGIAHTPQRKELPIHFQKGIAHTPQ